MTRWEDNKFLLVSDFLAWNYSKLIVTNHGSSFRFEKIATVVTISNHSLPAGVAVYPSLDSFRESAQKGEALHVGHDGSEWKVLATGTAPGQRSVAWVEPQSDTQSAFIGALGQAFSSGIQAAVVRELGLGPAPGQPLASRVVQQAIAMAETSQKAMLGVDFMTQLMYSALASSSGFVAACEAEGVPLAAVSGPQREAIDAAMQQRFAQAASQGQSPIAPELAQQWLRFELLAATGQAQTQR